MDFTVCIIDRNHNNKVDMLAWYHGAVHRVFPAASMHALYMSMDRTPSFISPEVSTHKFVKKVDGILDMQEGAIELECIQKGISKMVAVWRRKHKWVVVRVVCFTNDSVTPDLGLGDSSCTVHLDNVSDMQAVYELLCRQYHLVPLIKEESRGLLGLVRLPALELPVTSWDFPRRAKQLHQLKPRVDGALLVAEKKMVYVPVHDDLPLCRWMDDDGHVYEAVKDHLYRVKGSEEGLIDVCPADVPKMVLHAHLKDNSIIVLPKKMSSSLLCSYRSVLFNAAFPLLFQLSQVFQKVFHVKAELDLLRQLLSVISRYCKEKSPDLFQGANLDIDLNLVYSQLLVELNLVAEADDDLIGPLIRSIFTDTEQGELAEPKKRKTSDAQTSSYLSIEKGQRPQIQVNNLLKEYYRPYLSL